MHSLPWITIFWSLVMRFVNDFHSWLRHSRKSLANRLTRDTKIVIHGNSCITLYIFYDDWMIARIFKIIVLIFSNLWVSRLQDYLCIVDYLSLLQDDADLIDLGWRSRNGKQSNCNKFILINIWLTSLWTISSHLTFPYRTCQQIYTWFGSLFWVACFDTFHVSTTLKLFKQERDNWILSIRNLIRRVETLHNSTMTSSNGNILRVTGPLCGEFAGHRWIPFTKPVMRALMFSLTCAWTNGWVKKGDFGDLRCHCAHYDVTVMLSFHATDVRHDNIPYGWCSVRLRHAHLFHNGL